MKWAGELICDVRDGHYGLWLDDSLDKGVRIGREAAQYAGYCVGHWIREEIVGL